MWPLCFGAAVALGTVLEFFYAKRCFGLTAPTPQELIVGMVIGLIATLFISVVFHGLLKKILGLKATRIEPEIV